MSDLDQGHITVYKIFLNPSSIIQGWYEPGYLNLIYMQPCSNILWLIRTLGDHDLFLKVTGLFIEKDYIGLMDSKVTVACQNTTLWHICIQLTLSVMGNLA